MATFTPPTVDDVPRVLPNTQGPARSLFRRYAPLTRGRSVLKNADGSYTVLDTPTGDQIDAAVYAYIGGHEYEVTNAEATALIAAGFTVTGDVFTEPDPDTPPPVGNLRWSEFTFPWSEFTFPWSEL